MPVKGFSVITVSNETYSLAKKKADKNRRSISNYIRILVEDDKT